MERVLKYDVTVVGAGLIGATFALLLAQRSKLKIAVVERSPALLKNEQANQRVVALGALATSLLDEVGIFETLTSEEAFPYTKMFVWDENSNGELSFDAGDYGQDVLGHMVDSMACNLRLQNQMSHQDNIDTFYDFQTNDILVNKAGALLAGEPFSIETKLLVAADGGGSWVRQQAKIFSHRQAFGQVGIVAKIRTERNHQQTAWQRFLGTGPIAVLPLNDNQSSIVWSVDIQHGDRLMQLSDADFADAVAAAIQNRLGRVELLSARKAFPLQSQRAEVYFKACIVLLGDAAHSIHPLAGQGANLGFKDASCLVDLLQLQSTGSLSSAKLLGSYQRTRKVDNEQTDWLMHALHKAYRNNIPWWQVARGAGMRWLGSSGRLKALLAKNAMGI